MRTLDVATMAGVHRIKIGTPFAVGDVNVYLLEGKPLTLIDCGPNLASALDQLESGLATLGYALSDIEVLFLTHEHMDHSGLTATIAKRSGAEVVAIEALSPVLRDWVGRSRHDDDFAFSLMLRHGLEPRVAETLRQLSAKTRGFGAQADVDRTVRDGDRLALGDRRFEVQYRPGHSPSDTVLYDEESRLAIWGDHLLAAVSSNALITPHRSGADDPRPRTLVGYRKSLRLTRRLDLDVGLGGHGKPVTDHRELIDIRLRGQDERAAVLFDLLADGPRSAHELATSIWGKTAITQAFLTLSEVLGHLDLLVEGSVVAEDNSDQIIRFERT